MEIINYFIAFIIGVFFALIIFFIRAIIQDKKPKNKVHFYVARDSDDALYLYLSKPVRRNGFWGTSDKSVVIGGDTNFFLEKHGLKWEDFKGLKWEDEPVEVFLNLED